MPHQPPVEHPSPLSIAEPGRFGAAGRREQRTTIAVAKNLNNSDLDFCQWQGRLVIHYSWGNQQGIEFLAEAAYDGTETQFLRAWFPKH